MTGQEMLAEKQRLLKRLEKIPQERAATVAASTEAKIAALSREERETLNRIQEISREEGRLYHASTPTAREIELEERIRDLANREQHVQIKEAQVGDAQRTFGDGFVLKGKRAI